MRPKGLSAYTLKWIAIVAMAVDHIGAVFFPGVWWMRLVGRLTMPIMSFLVAEGLHYTRNRGRYAGRLFLFGLLSQVPFSLAFQYASGNVMFTLGAAVLFIWMLEKTEGGVLRVLLMVLACVLALFSDWSLYGFGYVLAFYFLRGNFAKQAAAFCGVSLLMIVTTAPGYADMFWTYHLGVFPALLLLWGYRGARGRDMRWLFYLFYPAHLAVIAAARYLM